MSVWVLKKSLLIVPFYGWVVLLPIKCKELRWCKGKCHRSWRMKNRKWVSKNGVFKGAQELKDLKKYSRG